MALLQAVKNNVLGRSSMIYKQVKLGNRRIRIFDANHETGSIFVHIPKTGGFSVAKALYGVDPWHFPVSAYEKICEVDKFLTFAVVREPAGRLYSMYNYLRHLPYTHPDLTGCQTAPTFAEFCRRWAEASGPGRHPFLLSQLDYLGFNGEGFRVDRVLRLESLDADYAALRTELGLEAEALPHFNKSAKADPMADADRKLCRELLAAEYAALDY